MYKVGGIGGVPLTVFLIDVYLYMRLILLLFRERKRVGKPSASGRPSCVQFIGYVTPTTFPLCKAF